MKKKKNVEEMNFLSDILSQTLTDMEDTNKLTINVADGVIVFSYMLQDNLNCIF